MVWFTSYFHYLRLFLIFVEFILKNGSSEMEETVPLAQAAVALFLIRFVLIFGTLIYILLF